MYSTLNINSNTEQFYIPKHFKLYFNEYEIIDQKLKLSIYQIDINFFDGWK